MIVDLLNQKESKTVEFKEDLPKKNQIAKTACAFANRAGGHIIIGVNDQGTVTGISEDLLEEYLDRISNIIYDSVYPMLIPELYTYKLGNANIIVVQIYPGNSLPYYLKNEGKIKGTYIRVGKTNKAADIEMLKELERQRQNKTFDEDISREANNEDINELSKILGGALGKAVSEEKLQNLNLIERVGDISYFTNAVEIILGKMENCRIKCARFTGDSVLDFIDRKEYEGDIIGQLNNAIGFIKNHLNVSGIISGMGLNRRDILEIPEEVLREAVVNAVLHRDYSISGSDIKIAVYNSRIEVVSPGGLPKTITIDEIYAGRSEIRNKIIARVFREAGIIEQWGSGIPRIREACIKEGLKAPQLSEEGLFVRLTIYRRVNDPSKNRTIKDHELNDSKTMEIAKEKQYIYDLLCKDDDLTLKQISKDMGISEASVQRRLDRLQKEKSIARIGSKKSGKWKIV